MTSTDRPLYQQIADDLRGRIVRGELGPGDWLPSEAELCATYSTARNTARQAVGVLVNEGLVVRARPRGVYVRTRQPMVYRPQQQWRPRPPETDLWTVEISDRAATQQIEVSIVEPPADVRERLGLAAGELAAVRRRTRHIDGELWNLQDSYVRLADVQGSEWLSPGNVDRGTNRVLEELGIGMVRALDEITIRMPDPMETARLGLPAGTPVGVLMTTGYTAAGQPVQVTINVLPGDRHTIVYERTKPASEAE